jgi:hypothetical protein
MGAAGLGTLWRASRLKKKAHKEIEGAGKSCELVLALR